MLFYWDVFVSFVFNKEWNESIWRVDASMLRFCLILMEDTKNPQKQKKTSL